MSVTAEQVEAQEKERRIDFANELIRMVKAMQTDAIQQREAIGHAVDHTVNNKLRKQLADVHITAQNHIDALQHVIYALQPPKK